MNLCLERDKPHLTGVFLDQFQSIREPAYIRLNGITMLYGPNSAGKSSVLDALDVIERLVNDDAEDCKTENIWATSCDSFTRLGITYRGMRIEKDFGIRQSIWLSKEVNYDEPHIHFLRLTLDKEISVELSNHGDSIKIAVDGRPLFELHARKWRGFREDFTPAVTDEDREDAEFEWREIVGKLIVYLNHPQLKELLPNLWRFHQIATAKREIGLSANGKKWYIEDCEDLRWIFEDDGESFSLSGIVLSSDWKYGKNRRYSVNACNEAEKFLRKNDLRTKLAFEKIDIRTGGQRTRLFLLDGIADAASSLDIILEGIFYQIYEAIKRDRVHGNRGLLDSDIPMYVSEHSPIFKSINSSHLPGHLISYAEARSGGKVKFSVASPLSSMSSDFVNKALTDHMESLSGYRVNAEVHISRPRNKKKAREHAWFGRREALMVFLNVEDDTGRILRFQDVGSGISYALPIFTCLWASTLSFVEQPELHLHPAAQCELADVFIAAKNQGSISVIESHSEHLLLRILRRIRESTLGKRKSGNLKLSPDDIRLYYFHPIKNYGTKVIEIRVDPHGEFLTRWPGGFFAERDRELFDE